MAIQTVEQILGVPAEEVNDMLRDLLFQEVFCNGYKPTDLDFKKTARFIQRTQLNPFDGTMFARRTNLGIEIGLRIDGWLQLAKQAGVKEIIHTYSDGFLTFAEMARDVRGHEWIETTLLVSDGGRFVHREYLAENFFNTEAWCLMPNRSLGHKSTAQTIRLFTGVYVADENQASISPKDGGLTVVVDSGPAAEVEAKPAETPVVQVEADPAETPAAQVEAKPTTLEEIIKFPWGGYLPSDRLRGDVRIGFGRTVQTKQWGALRGYFKSTRMSDEDRTWVLAALDQMEAVTHG